MLNIVVKIKNDNKSYYTILCNPKDSRSKNIDKALQNKIRKKIIYSQSNKIILINNPIKNIFNLK